MLASAYSCTSAQTRETLENAAVVVGGSPIAQRSQHP